MMSFVLLTATVPNDYTWIMVLSIFAGFFVSYGIGANDVANAFATSVGAKSLTLRQACLIASVFEFCGAFLMGSHVTDTVRKKIVDNNAYTDDPSLLMLGMFCALLMTGFWLLFATKFGLPVSTTHSIIGAIIGFALASKGESAVYWGEFTKVVLSWIISPALAAAMGFVLFMIIKFGVLERDDPIKWGMRIWPFFMFVFMWINVFFIIYKGTPQLGLKNTPLDLALGVTFAIAGGSTIITYAATYHYFLKKMKEIEAEDIAAAEKARDLEMDAEIQAGAANVFSPAPAAGVRPVPVPAEASTEPEFESNEAATEPKPAISRFKSFLAYDPDDAIKDDEAVQKVHDNAKVYSRPVEHMFTYLQIGTACFDSFAHGANDVANAIGPLAAVYAIWSTNKASKKADVELWQLAIGGVGIIAGLATLGYHIIEAIGVKLCKITPSRGFAIELGSAATVVTAARLAIPVSTTHCQVGATTGVALAEGRNGINWMLFVKVICSWLVTCVISGTLTAALFSFMAYSPSAWCQ